MDQKTYTEIVNQICKAANIENKAIYNIELLPGRLVFHRFALKNGAPYLDESKDDAAREEPLTIRVDDEWECLAV